MAAVMSGRRRWALLVIVLGVAGIVWWRASDDAASRAQRRDRETGNRSRPDGATAGAGTDEVRSVPEDELRSAVAALRSALETRSGAAEAAAALRRIVRQDAVARRAVQQLVLADETSRDLRMALALILGTVAGNASDETLLAALKLFADDIELVRCILFALGATREPPEDDEVFELGDRPWGAHGPGGLGITVHRAIEDPAVQRAVAGQLNAGDAGIREAAAQALRHTMHAAGVRASLLAAVRAESDDDVALVLGEALAAWAGGAAEGTETAQVVDVLLARAADAGLDGFRFRIENDFRRIGLTAGQRAVLVEYAHPARPFGVRSFALSVLAAAAVHGEATQTRALLERLMATDTDAAVRDLSARLLGMLALDSGTIAKLAETSRADEAWNVRYQAVDALGRFGNDPAARAALRSATGDADERVAAHARELHAR